MKIDGRGPHAPPGATPEDGKPEGVKPGAGKSEAEKAGQAGAPEATRGPSEARRSFAQTVAGTKIPEGSAASGTAGRAPAGGAAPRATDVAVGDVAAELAAGKLTSRAAIDQVVERVLLRQLGPDAAPAMREQVRAALMDALESDPLLADKLKRLD